jgi:MATE family multidrug resistance protein
VIKQQTPLTPLNNYNIFSILGFREIFHGMLEKGLFKSIPNMPTTIFHKFSLIETRLLLKLAIPLILTGLVEASVGFFSTLFLARLGPKELAAGALVTWLFVTIMVVLWGTLTSVSVLVAQKHGAKDNKGVSFVLRDGMFMAVVIAIPAFLLLWYMAPILLLMGQNPDVVVLANAYLHGLAWGLLPDFTALVLLQFLIGLGHARTSMFFTLLWVPISVSIIYVLIFGKFGFPALGIAGIGWGMTISYWITTTGLFIYILAHSDYKRYFRNILQFVHPYFFNDLLAVGLPMGAMYCIEVGFFLVITLIMGHLGSQILAANQIIFQYLGQLMAVVFSIAQAVTVRMGHKLGSKQFHIAEQTAYAGIVMSFTFMLIVAILYWFFPKYLIAIDFDISNPSNNEIVKQATRFFAICAIFQLLEGMRIALYGALRTLKDTRFTLLISILSFWGVALPLGYLLAIPMHLSGDGLWWGMVIGAGVSCLLLYWRFQFRIAKIERLAKGPHDIV